MFGLGNVGRGAEEGMKEDEGDEGGEGNIRAFLEDRDEEKRESSSSMNRFYH